MLLTHNQRPSHADKSNKQQETYADMIIRFDEYAKAGYIIPIGVNCLLCF